MMTDRKHQPVWKIGELARRLQLNVRTLRYYEAIGLLPPPKRSKSGYRLYSEVDEQRVRFILQSKRLGFTLEEIRQIFELERHGSPCAYMQATLSRRVGEIEAQIHELQHLRDQISQTMGQWRQSGGSSAAGGGGSTEDGPFSSMTTPQEPGRMRLKRSVEVFTAACPVCDPVVDLVQRVAGARCEVTIHNVRDDPSAAARAKAAAIARLPVVLVDGQPLECCRAGPITDADLRAAGIDGG